LKNVRQEHNSVHPLLGIQRNCTHTAAISLLQGTQHHVLLKHTLCKSKDHRGKTFPTPTLPHATRPY